MTFLQKGDIIVSDKVLLPIIFRKEQFFIIQYLVYSAGTVGWLIRLTRFGIIEIFGGCPTVKYKKTIVSGILKTQSNL